MKMKKVDKARRELDENNRAKKEENTNVDKIDLLGFYKI